MALVDGATRNTRDRPKYVSTKSSEKDTYGLTFCGLEESQAYKKSRILDVSNHG